MIAKRIARISSSAKESELLKNVEEKRKQQESLVPYLHDFLVSDILIRLPLDSLHRSMFVCKPWFNIVCSTAFIESHLGRSESVLIFTATSAKDETFPRLTPSHSDIERLNTLSVEAKYMQSKSAPLFHNSELDHDSKLFLKFLEFEDGMSNIKEYKLSCFGKIRATCNGLILLDNKMKKGGLIVVNPVTRKLAAIPPGTLFPSHDESYGFALDDASGEYKVVHLFRDSLTFIGCEIFILGSRRWKAVDGPSFGLFGWLGYRPVAAIGALHWIPHVDRDNYIVSLETGKENFHTIPLPNSCGMYDGIVDTGYSLSFVTHQETHIDIWILKGLFGEVWIKQHSIYMGCRMDIAPVISLRIKGDLIFKSSDGSFYIYDFELRSMTKVNKHKGLRSLSGSLFSHVNSMVSWSSN